MGAAGPGARHVGDLGHRRFRLQMHRHLQPAATSARLAWDDPTVGIEWPLPAGTEPKLSAKDKLGKSFADIEKFG